MPFCKFSYEVIPVSRLNLSFCRFNFTLDVNKSSLIEYLFGEDQSRYLVEISKDNFGEFMRESEKNNVSVEKIGITQADQFEIKNIGKIKVDDLIQAHESWFKKFTN